ncbi:putative synaptic vesicle protein [Operophtera brumata]|uniref:Putative synaptic vesicle protein n=1 Tax=Operophtera brumata TaxID=104452 RepID=A0A0L7LI36_OPEBR|nr:putative synaptic vesicle protein [Operophtera brumata]
MFLKLGFGGIFLFSVIAGSSQSYEVLLAAKFFEGVFFATSISAHVTFISEFCYKDIRDRVMICQASFVAIAQIISPLMSWGILTQEWKYTLFNGYVVLNTWNFYLYIMSLWSLFACVFYSTLPESPKYLVTQRKYDEAREILIKIYKENTGKTAESYPFIDIWKNLDKHEVQSVKSPERSIRHQIVVGLHNVKPIFRKPLVYHLAILSSSMFLILAIYNIVRLWFPQLSTIVEHYRTDGSQDMCVILDTYTSDLKTRGNTIRNSTADICVPTVSGSETYINSIIIGFVCFFPYFITGAVVNKVGKKALLVVCGVISIGVTLGLRYANSKIAVVALFAAGTAISQLMKALNQAVAVELFPTEIR